jgi:hypothetical protein
MKLRTRFLKNSIQVKGENGWILTIPKKEIQTDLDPEYWAARRFVRAVWPIGSFSVACVDETDTSKEWFASQ